MLMDPRRDLHEAISIGVFVGRIIGLREDGSGIVRGFAGPHRVLVPADLLNGKLPGRKISYHVKLLPAGVAVATQIVHARSLR
jgi:hypothetical protein